MSKVRVEVAECTHCGSVTLAPESDMCACGQEMYPVSHLFPAGTRIRGAAEFLLEDGRSKTLGSNPAGEAVVDEASQDFRRALVVLLSRRHLAGFDVWAQVSNAARVLWGDRWDEGMET
jgi:hypothetical protein